jgi:hypothetical protein
MLDPSLRKILLACSSVWLCNISLLNYWTPSWSNASLLTRWIWSWSVEGTCWATLRPPLQVHQSASPCSWTTNRYLTKVFVLVFGSGFNWFRGSGFREPHKQKKLNVLSGCWRLAWNLEVLKDGLKRNIKQLFINEERSMNFSESFNLFHDP